MNIPNSITTIRLILAGVVGYFLVTAHISFAIIVYLISLGLDIIDGMVARKLNQATKFGEHYDIIVDCLMTGVVFLIQLLEIPLWITILVSINYVLSIYLMVTRREVKHKVVSSWFKKYSATSYFLLTFIFILNIYTVPMHILSGLCIIGMYYFGTYKFIQTTNPK